VRPWTWDQEAPNHIILVLLVLVFLFIFQVFFFVSSANFFGIPLAPYPNGHCKHSMVSTLVLGFSANKSQKQHSKRISILLTSSLTAVVRDSQINPYISTPGALPISDLFFADDCLFLGRASQTNARDFRRVVEHYCYASGQRVNFQKSGVYFGPKISSTLRSRIIHMLGIQE